MAKLTEEQRQRRAQAKLRAEAENAERRAARRAARDRLWEKAGTRLSRSEFEAGVPCRGCGQPLLGNGDELAATDEERRAAFRERHGQCGEASWSIERSNVSHCSWCCPPPPWSQEWHTAMTRSLWGNAQPEQSRQYDEWEIALICGHSVRPRWYRDREWKEKVHACPTCRTQRGVLSSRHVGPASAWVCDWTKDSRRAETGNEGGEGIQRQSATAAGSRSGRSCGDLGAEDVQGGRPCSMACPPGLRLCQGVTASWRHALAAGGGMAEQHLDRWRPSTRRNRTRT